MPKYSDFDLDLQNSTTEERLAYITIASNNCPNTMRIPCNTGDAFKCDLTTNLSLRYDC